MKYIYSELKLYISYVLNPNYTLKLSYSKKRKKERKTIFSKNFNEILKINDF